MTITFVKAHAADHTQLTDISFRSKRYWNYPERFYELWRKELTITQEYINKHLVYTARTDGMVLGYYSIVEVPEDHWSGKVFVRKGFWLDHTFVRPEFIGQGIGTRLIEHVKDVCRDKGISRLYIFTDPHCEGFYQKVGATFVQQVESSIEGRFIPLYELVIG
jgi:maltose O-acetyltransferase